MPSGSVVKLNQAGRSATGTVIALLEDGDGLILTCAHDHDEKKPVEVLVERKRLVRGKVVALNEKLDCCLVRAPVGKGFEPIPLADELPKIGECLVAGFGDNKYLERRTKLKAVWKSGQWLEVEAPGRPGDSGGPVIQAGKLVGMHLRGHDGLKGDGYAKPIAAMREWLDSERERLSVVEAPKAKIRSVPWRD